MSQQKSPWRRCGRGALAVLTGFGLVLAPTIAHAAPPAPDTTWEASLTSLESGVKSGYQLAAANGSVYVADAQWRVDGKTVGTPENTPMASGNSMRSTFSPYGIAVDPDVNGEAVIVTTTARQRDSAAGYGGGVVIYNASQGAPTDADRVFEFEDGSPVLAGPRRVAVDTERNIAYVTNLGQARSSKGPGFVLVLDLTKRGADAVIARVGLPGDADNEAAGWWSNPVGSDVSTEGVVGVAVDEANNRVYLGTMTGEKLFVLDGSQIDGTKDPKNTQAYAGAVTELDATVGANARPTFNADTKKVYVSAYDASKITVVDADPASDTYGETEHVIDVTTGSSSGNKGTNAVEVDAERGLLYSANLDAGVTVYDIENDYAPIEFTAEDGSTYTDIVTGDRVVNFGLNEDTGEVWVSTHAAAGKVHVISVTESAAPKFTSQPSDQEADAGETATFEVVVAGSPAPTLQWQTRSGLGAAWTDIAGATGSWIEVQAVRELDGAQYRVIAVNEHGDETSQEAMLSVNYAPVVTASPTTQVVQAGGTATFTASGHGKPAASVVWQSQAPGETGWSIVAGATSATLTVPDVTVEQRGTLYRAVFTNALGDAPTQAASLAVNAVKPAPLEESVWREFVPEDTEGLLELPEGELVGVQTGTTVTISNIPVADGDWVEVFGFSKAQYLGSHLVANNGQITVNVAAFAEGTHHLAVYNANNELLGYVTFVINADGSGTVIDTPPGTRVLEATGAEGMLPLAIGAGAALLLGAAALTLAAYRRRVASE